MAADILVTLKERMTQLTEENRHGKERFCEHSIAMNRNLSFTEEENVATSCPAIHSICF